MMPGRFTRGAARYLRIPQPISTIVVLLIGTSVARAAPGGLDLTPGLYQVEVRIALPNVQYAAPPIVAQRCVTTADLANGRAFFVVSDNPIVACPLIDYRVDSARASYRIVCPGPNTASAVAVFEIGSQSYSGTINMNMGGKNMTMSETQIATRVGKCK